MSIIEAEWVIDPIETKSTPASAYSNIFFSFIFPLDSITKRPLINETDFFVSKSTPVIIKINEFAASSIDILVRCFANTNEYERFLEIKDNLAIEIKQIVEKRKASFAFPSQSIYVEKN